MSFRRQLPVYSPLNAGAILAGARALLLGGDSAERQVLAWLETEYGTTSPLLTDSGTSALTLAMRASQSRDRVGVALPAYGCYDLVTAAIGANVPVRWYDVDPATLGPDWTSFEAALSTGAAAAVIVHYYGIPVDLRSVREVAQRTGALIIEDAAQGIGGSVEGRALGALGDLGVLSFGRGKGLTGGGGGALLLNTAAGRAAYSSLDKMPGRGSGALRTLTTTLAQWLLARPSSYALPSTLPFLRLGETVFRQPKMARQINRAELGILSRTVDQVRDEAESRRRNAARLAARLDSRAVLPAGTGGQPGYLRLPLLIQPRRRSALSEGRALGIMRGYPLELNELPGPTRTRQGFPGARSLVDSLITVPVHSHLSESDLQALEKWIESL